MPEIFEKKDKLFKICPLHEGIKKACLSLPRYCKVATAEQMNLFTGICLMKQFVRGKPNPEELKNFVYVTPNRFGFRIFATF